MEPIVGMGATAFYFSDREAHTVIEVLTPKKVVIQQDTAAKGEGFDFYGHQNYEFAPDPQGSRMIVTKRKNGAWVKEGAKASPYVCFGTRQKYLDPSF